MSNLAPMVQIELDYWHDDPNILVRTILSNTHNFISQTLTKTLEYYKLILTDSKSLILKPHENKNKKQKMESQPKNSLIPILVPRYQFWLY